jgi:hypothetical protein
VPYSGSGIYTPPTGAENQVPGNVIRSATWNTIFVDLATALSGLGQGTQAVQATKLSGTAYASLPTATAGLVVYITDSTVNTWGATVTAGGGTDPVVAWYNGTVWKVIGA